MPRGALIFVAVLPLQPQTIGAGRASPVGHRSRAALSQGSARPAVALCARPAIDSPGEYPAQPFARGRVVPLNRPRPSGPAGGVSRRGGFAASPRHGLRGGRHWPPRPPRAASSRSMLRSNDGVGPGFLAPPPSPAGPHGTVPGPPPRSSPGVCWVARPASAPAPPPHGGAIRRRVARAIGRGQGGTPVRHFRRGVIRSGARVVSRLRGHGGKP